MGLKKCPILVFDCLFLYIICLYYAYYGLFDAFIAIAKADSCLKHSNFCFFAVSNITIDLNQFIVRANKCKQDLVSINRRVAFQEQSPLTDVHSGSHSLAQFVAVIIQTDI